MSREGKAIESGIYQKGEVNFPMIIEAIKTNKEIKKAGSILSFNGIVRETAKDGQPVEGLTIDAYTELANESIEKICSEITQMEGIIDIKIIHLKGKFDISEDLVYVVVAFAHRDEGFEALRTAVERYKSEIEVWKREELLDGSSEWTH
jgi:molybdopterin synthase catalytic subunit